LPSHLYCGSPWS